MNSRNFYRVKGLENTPLYVKPQLSCSEGVVRVNILVGIRIDPGRTIENIVVDVPWPPTVTTAELTANHGTVLFNSSTKVRELIFFLLAICSQ